MIAPATEIATRVTAAIKARADSGALAATFVPERSYADWQLEIKGSEDELLLKQTDGLHVDVVAHTTSQTVESATRGGKVRFTVPVDVAVRKKFRSDKIDDVTGRVALSEIDALVQLTVELLSIFWQKRLLGFEDAVWDAENEPQLIVCANPVHLREFGQFTSVVRQTFRTTMDLV